jgi:hypothetical protein
MKEHKREATVAQSGLTTVQWVLIVFFVLLAAFIGAAFVQDVTYERTLRGH